MKNLSIYLFAALIASLVVLCVSIAINNAVAGQISGLTALALTAGNIVINQVNFKHS